MLSWLETRGVGPSPSMRLELADRFNIITGDNGLGKSFLLDLAWWTLTGTWAGEVATPTPHLSRSPSSVKAAKISWQAHGQTGPSQPKTSSFRPAELDWSRPQNKPPMPGLTIYVRVDGSFSVFDPARNYWKKLQSRDYADPDRPPAFHFSAEQVWRGLEVEGAGPVCEGLLRDWVSWELKESRIEPNSINPFAMLRSALRSLSPSPAEPLRPGPPSRVLGGGARDVPTLETPYGVVPLQHASAAVRRILALTYLVIWAWHEHTQASETLGQAPAKRLMLLWDEVETHLHPQWQRRILPAVLGVLETLAPEMWVQVLATSHSPLVLSSLEPSFDPKRDRIHLLEQRGAEVHLGEFPFSKQGDASNWLLSEVFGLDQARSWEAEQAIEAAEAWMRGEREALPGGLTTQLDIHRRLTALLPALDPFWARWDAP